jgi:uncharacterized protein YpiB (UPF0302 family)
MNNFEHRKRENVWILDFLASKDRILENIVFTTDIRNVPRGFKIAVKDAKGSPAAFKFFKNGEVFTKDPEKGFHDIRMNLNEITYVEIFLPNRFQDLRFMEVIEPHPYDIDVYLKPEEKEMLDAFLNVTMIQGKERRLKAEIDTSLSAGDEEQFKELSAQLKDVYIESFKFDVEVGQRIKEMNEAK